MSHIVRGGVTERTFLRYSSACDRVLCTLHYQDLQAVRLHLAVSEYGGRQGTTGFLDFGTTGTGGFDLTGGLTGTGGTFDFSSAFGGSTGGFSLDLTSLFGGTTTDLFSSFGSTGSTLDFSSLFGSDGTTFNFFS